ncbi:MAG: hypothetical protein H0V55_01860 [Thermoleophilaceae bacterium]|nr:hypothetical protein [Thermoleophilaceae bacterium]
MNRAIIRDDMSSLGSEEWRHSVASVSRSRNWRGVSTGGVGIDEVRPLEAGDRLLGPLVGL